MLLTIKNTYKILSYLSYYLYNFPSFNRKANIVLKTSIYPLSERSFLKNEIRRMKQYMLGSLCIADLFCTLANRKISLKEKNAIVYMSVLLSIYDDLFDRDNISKERLFSLISQTGRVVPTTQKEKIFLGLYKNSHTHIVQKEQFYDLLKKLFESQKNSKALSTKSDPDKIEQFSYEKGGYAALLLRFVLEHSLSRDEKKAIYELGGLIQLIDDIFDLYEDSRAEVCSLAYPTYSIDYLSNKLQKKLTQTLHLFYNLPYKRKNIKKFTYCYVMFCSRIFVCLEQLGKLIKDPLQPFNPHLFNRRQLICDMEKPINILKSIYYAFTYKY